MENSYPNMIARRLRRRCEQFLYPKVAKPQDGFSKTGLKVQKLLTHQASHQANQQAKARGSG